MVTVSINSADILIQGFSACFFFSEQSIEFSIMFVTNVFILTECLAPIESIMDSGMSCMLSISAQIASLISLVTYAIKSEIRTICPSRDSPSPSFLLKNSPCGFE